MHAIAHEQNVWPDSTLGELGTGEPWGVCIIFDARQYEDYADAFVTFRCANEFGQTANSSTNEIRTLAIDTRYIGM